MMYPMTKENLFSPADILPKDSHDLLTDDLTGSDELTTQQHDTTHELLNRVGEILASADSGLDELESNGLLGPAIVRGCEDLANLISDFASELENQSDNERRMLAQACLEDVGTVTQQQHSHHQQHELERQFSSMSEDDIMNAIGGAADLLRDVEYALRSIERDEANEIADVALTLARVFVMSLQSFHATVEPKDLYLAAQRRQIIQPADNIEEIIEEDANNDRSINNDDKNKTHTSSRQQQKKNKMDRLRVLWPPLGPTVVSACKWGTEEAIKQPLLAIALGLTLWPAAIMTVFMGTPLVIVDNLVLQPTYNVFQDGPIIQNLEGGAAQAFRVAKLSFLTSKLIGKQTARVISKQVDRHGGLGQITHNLTDMAIHKVVHPIETIAEAWGGISWGIGIIHHGIKQITTDDQERNEVAQSLEQ